MDEEPREPPEAASAGSQRLQRHRAQRGRGNDLRDGHGDEQPPIRRRQPRAYNRPHDGLT